MREQDSPHLRDGQRVALHRLLSVTRMLGDRMSGLDGLITVVFVMASIALGTLVGVSLYKWAGEKARWGRLQMGRVRSYVRRSRRR